ncbi:MAG: adaptor protein MecA, partial [Lachnospiraceae bacterium]|nr:adaptor protein MecA [Lachnospiraceae bacterium]
MKIERLSENQIRCTLYKADLADKELLLTELAYGTEKTKDLFRELMQQASEELGFEVDNIPLMIEAIPVSPECLVLIITKVEDPEE